MVYKTRYERVLVLVVIAAANWGRVSVVVAVEVAFVPLQVALVTTWIWPPETIAADVEILKMVVPLLRLAAVSILAVVVGNAPLLFEINSPTAPNTLLASLRLVVLRPLRCKAGTAKKTISSISPAIAKTIRTSMMVKPLLVVKF